MLTVDQIVANIVNQLRLLDPTVSAEVGTPERKLIEATAEIVAGGQVDLSVLNSQHDIFSMAGGRLDAYLSIFNFGRQQGTPSYGAVVFATAQSAVNAIVIPAGTQVRATTSDPTVPNLTFVTTQTGVIDAGQGSITIPAQCTIGGTIGNVAAKSITSFSGLQSIVGITSISNPAAMSGGTDVETDAQYKARFQRTFLRNMSGVTDMFLALAVAVNSVSKANVVGPVSRYQEYIQIPVTDDVAQHTVSGYDDAGTVFPHKRTSAKSTIPYSKFTYQANYYLTDGTLDPGAAYFFRPGVDFIFNAPPIKADTGTNQSADTPATSPNITFLNPYDAGVNPAGGAVSADGKLLLKSGDVVLVEHAYISKNSRNDYNFGILNCVDVFINGVTPTSVFSIEIVPSASNNLQNTNTLLWTYQKLTSVVVINFKRKLDGKSAAVGSRIQPLFWQPVLDLPDTIQIGSGTYYKANYWNASNSTYYNQYDGTTYSKPAHYCMVEEVNSNFGTIRSRNGIEWFLTGNNYLNGELTTDSPGTYSGLKIDAQAGTQYALSGYTYDANVANLQAIMEKNKQTTQDVLVHRAKYRYFQPIITIMYSPGSTKTVVDASINAALGAFYESQYFGSAVQLSDILQAIHDVAGVDNIRWTNPDTSGNKVQEVNADGSALSGGALFYSTDFFIQDNELAASPSANAVVITVRAQNTWGT